MKLGQRANTNQKSHGHLGGELFVVGSDQQEIGLVGAATNNHFTALIFTVATGNLVRKSVRNPAEFRDYSDSGPFELQNFHRNFYFSNRKMCSRQFGTRSHWFGILSRHRFFRFHESENVLGICIFLACQADIYLYTSASRPNNA
jgi:hypothetical protein